MRRCGACGSASEPQRPRGRNTVREYVAWFSDEGLLAAEAAAHPNAVEQQSRLADRYRTLICGLYLLPATPSP